MKRIGIISYNIFCNFTNYGSALQSFALSEAIRNISSDYFEGDVAPVLVPYCPKVDEDSNPLNPIKKMWDQDEVMRNNIQLLEGSIKSNAAKFDAFFDRYFEHTTKKTFVANDFREIKRESIDGFICGADTIFCTKEFGFDDGYFARFEEMKSSFCCSYAASFGDSDITDAFLEELKTKVDSFSFLGIREPGLVPYLSSVTNVPVKRVLDPTLLFDKSKYETIEAAADSLPTTEPYLLMYSRRRNPKMEAFAEKIAKDQGLKIVEISLRGDVGDHIQKYDAGVEEFLRLVDGASFVVTNSFHGLIFAAIYHKPFFVFSMEQADLKISNLLSSIGLGRRLLVTGFEEEAGNLAIDFAEMEKKLLPLRKESWIFLKDELEGFVNYGR